MSRIRSSAKIAEKWGRVTPERVQDYEDGVRNPKKSWHDETKAAESNYEEGIRQAIVDKRFGRGVDKAGDEAWKKGAIEKGTVRFGPGVQAAQSKYQEGFGPYHDVLESLTLPKRYPKGDPRNLKRVEAVAKALHEKKVKG